MDAKGVSMAASIMRWTRHLGRKAAVLKGSSRCLSSSALWNSNPTELSGNLTAWLISKFNSDELRRCGGRCLRPYLLDRRRFRASALGNQQSELEDDTAAADPAPGFQAIPLPFRNYTPVLSGFSVLPNPAVGVPAGLRPPSNAGSLNLEQLGREMSNYLCQGRLEETIQLFEDWLKFPDFHGKSKVPNIMAYNLLLHAKLRLGVDPRHLLEVIKEMEMSRLKPNLLSYNFLLRAIFRQRDSIMAANLLEKMQQSGPEAQPDGDSYNFVIVLCALERRIDAAMKHYNAMLVRGLVPSKTTYHELLLAATRVHRTRVAVDLLSDLKKRNIVPQLQTVVELAMVAAEVDDSECAHLAIGLLSTSDLSNSAKNLFMDEGGLYYLLSAAARAGDSSLSKQVWSILRNSLRYSEPPSPSSHLARIHALATAGDFDTAYEKIQDLEARVGSSQNSADREIFSPFSSLRPLVLACTRGGFTTLDAAYYKLAEMHAKGNAVTLSAINCVIQGCANIWDFDRAYITFETIGTTFGLMPDVHSCNSLLDVFGKTRKTTEVLQIFNYMHEVGVVPDERTYSLLVDAHVVNRDPKAAMDTVEAMTIAGHAPERRTLVKIFRRYMKEDNEGGAREVSILLKKFGHRDTIADVNKWHQIATS